MKKPPKTSFPDFIERCCQNLEATWQQVLVTPSNAPPAITDANIAGAIKRSVNSSTLTYRYVLPTQLLAKVTDPQLDCRCIQVTRGGSGTFDARSLCQKVIVPFDRANERVLGGSSEPYVNNPLRVPEVSVKYRDNQRDQDGWDQLCLVLEAVEARNDSKFTHLTFEQTLRDIRDRLTTVTVNYPFPLRISLENTLNLIAQYLAQPSGGDREEAITTGLLRTLGERFRIFERVERTKVNVPDAQAGRVADVEALDAGGQVVLAVPVTDRELTVARIEDALTKARARNVSELLFIAQRGIAEAEEQDVEELIRKEFSAGQNIYITDIATFASVLLVIVDEEGRRAFLENIAKTLDEFGSPIEHRRAWDQLLKTI